MTKQKKHDDFYEAVMDAIKTMPSPADELLKKRHSSII